ncbi:hypothetical protein C8J57DRAFT_1240479 [Mycena rebaudengoi]|nr:hypothetical protein C8J57DRAFT_1240479 [Mycena rebaudengoi]
MREFHRMAQLDGMLSGILDETSGDELPIDLRLEHRFIQLLFGTDENREALGTIQDAAVHERALSRVVPGSIAKKSLRIEDDAMRLGIVNYYNQNRPKVHLTRARPGGNTEMLGSFADTYSYALLDGRRVMSITESRRGAGSSLIQIHFKNELYAGEIRHIFRHK